MSNDDLARSIFDLKLDLITVRYELRITRWLAAAAVVLQFVVLFRGFG